jgi:hypothetical protein
MKEVRKQAANAKALPSQESLYRNYTLNQRVDRNTPFISQNDVAGERRRGFGMGRCAGLCRTRPFQHVRPHRVRADLPRRRGKWETKPTFWLPEATGLPRSREPTVCLTTCGQGKASSKPRPASRSSTSLLLIGCSILPVARVRKIAFDRWGMKYLKPWLLKAGFTEERIETFVEFGQGFQSMSPALRDLESALLAKRCGTATTRC